MTASAPETASRQERSYRHRIDAHFAGRGSPASDRELRAHLPACAACRDYYGRYLELAELDPEGAVPMRERLARGLGLDAATSVARRRFGLALSAALAVGAVALVAGLKTRSELQARGGPASPGSQLLVYEVAPDARARPVVSEMRGDSGLAFAYANIGRKHRLLVFAVDDERRVYWYHPSWRNPGDDPVAIDIVRDDALHEIPAAITHRFAGQRVQLFGVFVDDALSVRQVEALVARAPLDEQRHLRLSIAGATIARLDVRLVGGR